MLDVLAPDRAGAIMLAGGTIVIVARAAGTGTPGTKTVRVQQSRGAVLAAHTDSPHARARCRVMAVRVGVTGIVSGPAPMCTMAEVAVTKTGGTTTATHTMSAVTMLGVAVRVLAHGIASDTIMGC